jgi:hypothetical protein
VPWTGHLLIRIRRVLVILRDERHHCEGDRHDRKTQILHVSDYSTFEEKTAEIGKNAETRVRSGRVRAIGLSTDYADVRGFTGDTSGGAAQPRESERRIGRTRARSLAVARVRPIRFSLGPAASRPAPDVHPMIARACGHVAA